jgi:signal transduction histidine kinase
MRERWLTHLGGAPRLGLAAGAALALAAFGQAVGQAVTLGFANAGAGQDPGLLAFLYAVPLCALALLSTAPLLWGRPAAAAVVAVLANVLVLAVFPAPTVAGALAAVFAVWRLGAAGSPRGDGLNGWLRRAGGSASTRKGSVGVAGDLGAQYLAVGLALPFLVLALARGGNVTCVLLASAVPVAAGAGIALRAARAARTYSEAGEALADTLVAHTARGERARIARELHDVVAHHISMIAVQAETGRLTTPGLPEAGARRFAEIGDTARAGLTEMRRLLGVLREDAADPAAGERPAAASRQPQPGLTQLTGLIDAAREASVAGTRLIISGPVAPLDPGVELAAYRIVQEALTNARRHAPGAAVDVELRYGAGTLRLRVRDNGPGPAGGPDATARTAPAAGGPGDGATLNGATLNTGMLNTGTLNTGSWPAAAGRRAGGHGLLGMRERAFSVGGALYTGAAPGGGFLVEALLPAETDPAPAARRRGGGPVSEPVAGRPVAGSP